MITLITGVPGSGKTLYALNLIKAEAEKGKRPVYQSGIRELTLPWTLFGSPGENPDRSWETDASKWYDCPDGSIVVIDECQRLFRQRGTGAQVPETVARLETHRHHGLDIYLITQHPMLIDSNIRRLVGRHFHVSRKNWRGGAAKIREFSVCTEISPAAIKDAIGHDFKYPKEAFGWYKSAEVHTFKRRIPARLWFLMALPLIIGLLGWYGWHAVRGYVDGAAIKDRMGVLGGSTAALSSSFTGGVSGHAALSAKEYVKGFAPRVEGLAYSAPVYDELTKVKRAPVPAACVSSGRGCACFSQDSTRLYMPVDLCRSIVQDGFFVPFEVAAAAGSTGKQLPDRSGGPATAQSAVPVPVSASVAPTGATGATGATPANSHS